MDSQGVVLIGEAAMAYVKYKYVELIIGWSVLAVFLIVLFVAGYAIFKTATENDKRR